MDPSPLGEVLALGGRENVPDLPGVLDHQSHSSDVQAVSQGRHGRSENGACSFPVGLAFCSPDLALEELRFLEKHELRVFVQGP
eukprot:1008866-Heterocapsa_arctica.AAC.1